MGLKSLFRWWASSPPPANPVQPEKPQSPPVEEKPPAPPFVYYPDAPHVDEGIVTVFRTNGGAQHFDLSGVEVLEFSEVHTKDDRSYFRCRMIILGREHFINTPSTDPITREWRKLHRRENYN